MWQGGIWSRMWRCERREQALQLTSVDLWGENRTHADVFKLGVLLRQQRCWRPGQDWRKACQPRGVPQRRWRAQVHQACLVVSLSKANG
jgi:hypothetical protein